MVNWVERIGKRELDTRKELEKLRKKYEEQPEFPIRESDFQKFESLFPEFREIQKRKLPPRRQPVTEQPPLPPIGQPVTQPEEERVPWWLRPSGRVTAEQELPEPMPIPSRPGEARQFLSPEKLRALGIGEPTDEERKIKGYYTTPSTGARMPLYEKPRGIERISQPLYTPTEKGIVPADVLSLIGLVGAFGYGVYVGIESLIPVTKGIADKTLTRVLNAGLDKWIAQRSRGVPSQHFKKAQDALYNLIAKDKAWLHQRATENMLRRMGRTPKPTSAQAAKQATEDTIRDIENTLVPRATQTGAMAFGGERAKPSQFAIWDFKEGKAIPTMGKAIKITGFEEYDFFLARPIDYKGEPITTTWEVFEAKTGMATGAKGKTQTIAIKDATDRLTRAGKPAIDQAIKSGLETHAPITEAKPPTPEVKPAVTPEVTRAKPTGRHEVPEFGEEGAIPPPVPSDVAKAGRRRVIEARIKRGESVPAKLLEEFPDLQVKVTGGFVAPTPKGSVEQAIETGLKQAKKTGENVYVFPTAEGMKLGSQPPPFQLQHYVAKPDGSYKYVESKAEPTAVPEPSPQPPQAPISPVTDEVGGIPQPPAPSVKPPLGEPTAPPAEDPVVKLTRLIRSAKPVRKETEILKHEELSRRAGALAGAIKAGEGREAFLKAKGVLKGELPQAAFEPPEQGLTPGDITGLFNTIRDSDLLPFQKLNTSEALSAILGGKLPTRGDISLLEKMFGSDLAKALLAHRPLSQKTWDIFLQAWNVPRTLMASGELSASLRQGAYILPSHPKIWGRTMWAQLRATAKEKNAIAIDRDMQTNPGAEERDQYKVFHAPITGVGAKLTQREEVYLVEFFGQFVNWWEKEGLVKRIGTSPLYVVAKGVRIGERAYITFLNKLRADIFDSTAATWRKTEEPTPEELTWLARSVNDWTGRGSLGKLEESAPVLSGILFSPRLQASRIGIFKSAITDAIRAADDIAHGRPVNRTSREGLKAMVAFVGTGLMILGLAKLNGAEVSGDSNSADFGKIKIGKTRIDIWGSFQPYARFVSNMITGMRTSTITGQTKEVKRTDILKNFARSKLMPTMGFIYDALEGRTYEGEDFELNAEQALENFTPMFWQDMIDAINEEGLAGAFKALPGFLGVGIMTYDLPSWPELEEYFNIEDTVVGGNVIETATAKRVKYRMANPENEAKLFILGRFTTLKTPAARQYVLQIMEEHKIKPEDVRGYENVFGVAEAPMREPIGEVPIRTPEVPSTTPRRKLPPRR